MSALVRNLLAACSILFVCSCAAATKPNSSAWVAEPGDDSAHLASAFAQQNECYSAWSRLISDWERNGGGFKESLLAARNQISVDRASAFATIVRDVWSVQSAKGAQIKNFGRWPVSSADTTSVIISPNNAISKTLDQYLPHGCGAFASLYPVIWDKTHTVVDGKVKVLHFAEMPSGIVWDSYTTPRWVLYWLFVRIK